MSPKSVVVNKVSTAPSVSPATVSHASAESYAVTNGGDLIVLDASNNVIATYSKGTWGTVRSGIA